MAWSCKIATLLYCFNEAGEILLVERAQEPNRGRWSPCGGKLKMDLGESPYVCAGWEAQAELPPPPAEGRFGFFPRGQIFDLKIPQTDREQICAVVLAVSRRLFCGALPVPRGGPERVEFGRKIWENFQSSMLNAFKQL